MLHYVTGYTKSGKSEYAEKQVAKLTGSTVYIGTLPKQIFYSDTIQAHQKRRPDKWKLIELIGDPESDYEMIQEQLPQFTNILFDGLSFYLFRLSMVFDDDYEKVLNLSENLVDWAVQSDSYVVVVDSPINKTLPETTQRILLNVHLSILQNASSIVFFNKGNALPITKNEALQLDNFDGNSIYDPRINQIITDPGF